MFVLCYVQVIDCRGSSSHLAMCTCRVCFFLLIIPCHALRRASDLEDVTSHVNVLVGCDAGRRVSYIFFFSQWMELTVSLTLTLTHREYTIPMTVA